MKQRSLKNKSTAEGRAFWAYVERTAREVDAWPAWKRGEASAAAPKEEKPE